ncbi:MAG: hypothetical protein ACK5LV_08390 [Lachnospirales bacterium]
MSSNTKNFRNTRNNVNSSKKRPSTNAYNRTSEAFDYNYSNDFTPKRKRKSNIESSYLDRKKVRKPQYTKDTPRKRRTRIKKKKVVSVEEQLAKIQSKMLNEKIRTIDVDGQVSKIENFHDESYHILKNKGNMHYFDKMKVVGSCMFIVVTLLLMVSIYLKVSNELNTQRDFVENEKVELASVKANYENLELKLADATDDNVYKNYAKNNLGMDYPKQHQIVTIKLEKTNYTEVITTENTGDVNIKNVFAHIWVNDGQTEENTK